MKNVRITLAAVAATATMLLAASPVAAQDIGPSEPVPEQHVPTTDTPANAPSPLETPRPQDTPQQEAPQTPGTYTVPAFKVEAINFTALDETGINWIGSDEIYLTWGNPDDETAPGATSEVFGDVDAGDTKYLHEYQRCMYPIGADSGRHLRGHASEGWDCFAEGAVGDANVRVDMFEADGQRIGFCFKGTAPSCRKSWIGGASIDHSVEELVAMLPTQQTSLEITVRLGKACYNSPQEAIEGGAAGNACGVGSWEADYDFTYRITRVDDQVRYNHDDLLG